MPIISGIRDYNGFAEKIGRLGLDGLIEEAAATVTRFPLLIEERRHINELSPNFGDGLKNQAAAWA
jgi:hypothetical protein